MTNRIQSLIEALQLEPHPEGGYYREVFRSPHRVKPADERRDRSALTAIYFLLAAGQHSRWHRVASDEVWTHLEGDPIEILRFEAESGRMTRVRLGPYAPETPQSRGADPVSEFVVSAVRRVTPQGRNHAPHGAHYEQGSEASPSPVSHAKSDTEPIHIVPAGVWQAARPLGEYALVGCFVAPGFDFADFRLAADNPAAAQSIRAQGAEFGGLL